MNDNYAGNNIVKGIGIALGIAIGLGAIIMTGGLALLAVPVAILLRMAGKKEY